MYTVWTKHLKDPQEKAEFEKNVKYSKWILEHLNKILTDMETDLGRAETNPKTYDLPGWDYRQAHNNGYRQALQIVKKLIDVDQQEHANERQFIATNTPGRPT